jgi:hypothetical protein
MPKRMKAHELIRAYDIFDREQWEFVDNNDLILDIHRSDDGDTWSKRIKSAFYWLFVGGSKSFREALGDGVGMRLSMFAYSLRRTQEMPDGHINNGSIITLWCEDGQYIELFQPTVGRLIADFLEAEPENEHAQKIAQEIERIGNREGAHHHER